MSSPPPLKRPTSAEELASHIGQAARNGEQVRVVGSDSFPLTQFDPARPLQPLSTLRMNKVLHHAEADMTVNVQAGVTLEALQKQLAWHDQWLPVDPPAIGGRSPGARTIGGLIASNALGPLRFGLSGGDWRRLILGMRWVDGTGQLIKGGGQTVKNVAGYSSPRMMIGSAGALGAIAEITLRTFARPADERCILFFCPTAGQAEELLAALFVAAVVPDYVELVGGQTWRANPLGLPAPSEELGAEGQAMVLVAGFLGRPETCAAQVELARQLPAAHGIETIAQTAAQAGRLRLWMTSEPAPTGDTSITLRLHVLSSEVAGAVARLEQSAATKWVASEAGSGVIRAALSGDAAYAVIRELASRYGGRLWTLPGNFLPASRNLLAERLKETLDPQVVFGKMPAAFQ